MTSTPAKNRKRFTPFGIIFALGGVVLFAYFVRQAGVSQIVEGIRRLGAGFVLILMISGIRHVVRSIAWMMCVEAPHRLRFGDALRARLMGDAIGNILPLGNFIISEPAKPALIRDRLPLMAGFSAMVIENIFYSLSVVTFVLSGMLALLLNFTLPKGLRLASIITVAVIAVMIALGVVLVRKQVKFISGATSFLHRRGLNQKWIEKSRAVEERVYGFYRKNGSRFLPIFLLEASFHLAGVIEIYVTLYFISPQQPPTLFTAFILESVNRVITMAFKFVPLRMGVDEAGTGRVSKILQFTQAAGVTLAIIRKARDVFWACVGVLLLLHRGWSLRAAARDAEKALTEVAT
ncbi:MAG TPA: lysylphosphatidylglycerol synthase domain-containing protein [Pyrinomonadaceae bacterium]